MNDYEEKIGPVVHTPRSELMCIRCKYLTGRLKRSGRDPIYEYWCEHPKSKLPRELSSTLIARLKEKGHEHLIPKFQETEARRNVERGERGEFIGNDSQTPEWCPVITNKRRNIMTAIEVFIYTRKKRERRATARRHCAGQLRSADSPRSNVRSFRSS